jgi:ankyrin repeat protein
MKNIKTYEQAMKGQEDLNRMLHHAALNGKTDEAIRLLDRGADPDAMINGTTPLHWAAYSGHTDLASVLLDRGANVNSESYDDKTALQWAAEMGRTEACRLLIQRGADPFKAFGGANEILRFFGGNINWMPEDMKAKIRRMQRGKSAFGM